MSICSVFLASFCLLTSYTVSTVFSKSLLKEIITMPLLIDSLCLTSLETSCGVHVQCINNTDDELGIKSACPKLFFHLHPLLFYFCCHSIVSGL